MSSCCVFNNEEIQASENNGPTLVAQSGGCRILLMSLAYSQPSFVSERQKQTLAYRKFK